MKIEIERSGGFSGIIKKITLDTEQLPKDIVHILENYLTESKLADKSSYMTRSKTADCYHYKISAQTGRKRQEINFSEFEIDQQFRTSVNKLFKKYKR